MKKKRDNVFLISALALLATLVALIAAPGVPQVGINALWVRYLLLSLILIVLISLNARVRRVSDCDETLGCMKRARRSLDKLIAGKDVGGVLFRAMLNQLVNAENCLEDLIAARDLYFLRSDLERLREISEGLKASDMKELGSADLSRATESLRAAEGKIRAYQSEQNKKSA